MTKTLKILATFATIFLLVVSSLNVIFVNNADVTLYALSLGLFIASLGLCTVIITSSIERKLLAAIALTIGIYIAARLDAFAAQITAAGAVVMLVTIMFYSLSKKLPKHPQSS